MSRERLHIVDVVVRSGISQRTGKPYTIHNAQCIVSQQTEEGEQSVVGTIFLPEHLKDAGKGEYFASFALAQSREGELVPRLVSLERFEPLKAAPRSPTSSLGVSPVATPPK